MTDEPRIYMRHARALGYCSRGSERLAERVGITYQQFLQEGYPVSLAMQSDNPLLRRAAELALDEWNKENGNG
ncbi:tail assembly chaperone [Providencia phage vB_PreS-PibeRecoleta]|uniref:Tail assembly protein n=2 Tax=Redjacvirus TaxID=2943015 RepID=A0A7G5B133_9CAUD|nr:tail assembly chaperone [Providencia phage vB_PreS-PibeRecoleta]YP_009999892.1 tail assembly chaperone [Providencia phage vB_PreS-Stilesk]ELR5076386.1 hypothetical protein [Providencia rettgeri]QMV29933.1 hypothetical protein [Providencia phage vB_PreS-PibeRecoleta]QMV30006.1 hypothetical protein [Providencia phage vB_PreS-Stilesk]